MPSRQHVAPPQSGLPEPKSVNRTRQARRDGDFALRLKTALGGRDQAWLARETGLSTSTIHDYAQGAVPSADRAFLIADALGVSPRWLTIGTDDPTPAPSDSDWRQLPYYPLSELSAGAFESRHKILLRADWLQMGFEKSDDLWITDMPQSFYWPGATDGEPIICASASEFEIANFYIVRCSQPTVVFVVRSKEGLVGLWESIGGGKLRPVPHNGHPSFLIGRILGPLLGKLWTKPKVKPSYEPGQNEDQIAS